MIHCNNLEINSLLSRVSRKNSFKWEVQITHYRGCQNLKLIRRLYSVPKKECMFSWHDVKGAT